MNLNGLKKNIISACIIAALYSGAVSAACDVTPEQDQNNDGYDDSLVSITARISDDSTVGCNGSTVGEYSRLSSGSEVKDGSTVGNRTRLKEGSTVSQASTVGNEVVLKASNVWLQSTIDNNVRATYATVGEGGHVKSDNVLRGYVGDDGEINSVYIGRNSIVESGNHITGNTGLVNNVHIRGSNNRIESSQLSGGPSTFTMGSGNYIKNSNLSGGQIKDNVSLKGVTFQDAPIILSGTVMKEGAWIGGRGQTVGPNAVIGKNATIQGSGFFGNSRLGEDALVGPSADILNHVRIGKRASIGWFTMIRNNVTIGTDAIINSNCRIELNARIGRNTEIDAETVIGEDVVVGRDVSIGYFVNVGNETVISRDVVMGSGLSRSQKATVGLRTVIRPNVVIGDEFTIGNDVQIGKGAQLGINVTVGDEAVIRPNSIVPDGTVIVPGETFQ